MGPKTKSPRNLPRPVQQLKCMKVRSLKKFTQGFVRLRIRKSGSIAERGVSNSADFSVALIDKFLRAWIRIGVVHESQPLADQPRGVTFGEP